MSPSDIHTLYSMKWAFESSCYKGDNVTPCNVTYGRAFIRFLHHEGIKQVEAIVIQCVQIKCVVKKKGS